MKLRVKPEDFVVEEITNVELSSNGDYSIYILKKKSIETIEIFSKLASKFNLDKSEIGFAGIKDKHAITTQYISIPTKYSVKGFIELNYSLKFVGYSSMPIKTGNLIGNKFKITIRDLRNEQLRKLEGSLERVQGSGVVNYFDSQRFGNVKNNVFVAKFLAKKDYESAVLYFLLSQYSFNKSINIDSEYKKLKTNWKNFGNLKLQLPYIDILQKSYLKDKSWKVTFKKIPKKLREIIVMSYQSYLWNECVKELIKKTNNFKKIEYNIGDLYFPNVKVKSLLFPMVGRGLESSKENLDLINMILKREGVTLDEIESISKSGSFLKFENREVIIFPKELKIVDSYEDKLYSSNKSKRFAVVLEFILPKGSYATITIKEIFRE